MLPAREAGNSSEVVPGIPARAGSLEEEPVCILLTTEMWEAACGSVEVPVHPDPWVAPVQVDPSAAAAEHPSDTGRAAVGARAPCVAGGEAIPPRTLRGCSPAAARTSATDHRGLDPFLTHRILSLARDGAITTK